MGVLKFHYTSTYEASHKLKGKKGNTHGYYIDEFADIFYEEWDKRDSATIRKKLKDLKQFRVDADYADMEVLENKVEKAEKIMDEFHRIIKKHMRL